SRIDASNPQGTKIPFAVPTITIGILPRLENRLIGNAVRATTRTVITLRLLENLLVTGFRRHPTTYSCHLCKYLLKIKTRGMPRPTPRPQRRRRLLVRNQSVHGRLISLAHEGTLGQLILALRRLLGQDVTGVGMA